MSDGEVMMTVLEVQKRLDKQAKDYGTAMHYYDELAKRVGELEADEWYKAGMATRGLLMLAYQLVLSFWAVGAVVVVLGVAWLIGQVIAGLQ